MEEFMDRDYFASLSEEEQAEYLNVFGKNLLTDKVSEALFRFVEAQESAIDSIVACCASQYALERWDEIKYQWLDSDDGSIARGGVPIVDPVKARSHIEVNGGPAFMAMKQMVADHVRAIASTLTTDEEHEAVDMTVEMSTHMLDHIWCDSLLRIHVASEATSRTYKILEEGEFTTFEQADSYVEAIEQLVTDEVAYLYDMGCTEDRHGTLADLPAYDV